MYQRKAVLGQFITLYHQLPETVRLVLTAILGATIGWITYEVLYWLNPLMRYRATTSWALSFLIGVARHGGNAGKRPTVTAHGVCLPPSPYWRSLGRAYLFYSVSVLVGSLTNYYLTVILGMHHRLAWLFCLAITALISLFLLKRLVFISENVSPRKTSTLLNKF